jgi:hypothetical protein
MALCFEIAVNRGVPIVAGLDDINVLTACITYVSSHQEVEVRVGGLVSKSRPQPSPPTHRRREDPEVAGNQERQYFLDLKKRYEPE